MGSIMTAVAVLDTHMLKKAVTPMKHATMPAGWSPAERRALSAMRRWSPQRCMARAMRKPPMNRKINSWA